MKQKLLALTSLACLIVSVSASAGDAPGHWYLGASLGNYFLDKDRAALDLDDLVVGSITAGYQFNKDWAADMSIGTDLGSDTDMDRFSLDVYRFFGTQQWRPFLSVGISQFAIDGAFDDRTEQVQIGAGLSGSLTDQLELRLGYQHHYDVGYGSNNDDSVSLMVAWHFTKPTTVAAAPAPQPESVPKTKEVVETHELLVQFDFDKAVVKSVYQPQFQMIAQLLKDNPNIDMTIEGHTCWIGTEAYNQGLSERRAEAVKEKFMQDFGLSARRINTVGYGELRPVADNNTRTGRERNRRAIAVILLRRMVKE